MFSSSPTSVVYNNNNQDFNQDFNVNDFFGGFDLPNTENNNNDENLLFPPQANDDDYLNLGFYSNPDWDQNLESYLSELA
ncbi:hypothetical protein G6F68_020800 [Rhizopus microsporus]|nr:hypothetical protein G6F68_020800 [Rhizopus microsporus]